ncbi:hypothetical protein QWY87_07825 [Lutimonas halocynthiae]|uniref:hypothetical protein n=1 Tax=Lutimonas halocynthiae TaxID=1446477 RepID=UPI0025B517DF|nr:hypothetical protein [Lutimonas halocynthiae]MDN3642600.1 hypothetical protein [Lutimonas halocynthiae]
MKNLARKSLVAIMLTMSLSMQANETELTSKEKERVVTNLHFDNVKQGSVLTIIDANGLVLYNEAIKKSGDYSKGFDLTTLPDGEYFFEMDSDLKIIVIPFNVKSNEVIFDKEAEKSIYKPVVRAKDHMVYVSKVAMDESPLSYKIYFADNRDLVYSEKFEADDEIKKVYDFSASQKGSYLFVFESNGRRYTKVVKI